MLDIPKAITKNLLTLYVTEEYISSGTWAIRRDCLSGAGAIYEAPDAAILAATGAREVRRGDAIADTFKRAVTIAPDAVVYKLTPWIYESRRYGKAEQSRVYMSEGGEAVAIQEPFAKLLGHPEELRRGGVPGALVNGAGNLVMQLSDIDFPPHRA